MKIQLEQEMSPDKQFELTYRIIEEYQSYVSDSAFVYIKKNIRLAEQENNKEWLIRTQLQYSFILSSTGLFIESESVLNSIPLDNLDNELLVKYYQYMGSLYININTYQKGMQITANYEELIHESQEAVVRYLPKNSLDRLYYKYLKARDKKDLDSARIYLESYLESTHPGTHDNAKKNYDMSQLYEQMGDSDTQIKYLILAVMSDVKDAVKENRALLDLSIWLYKHNDVERAFDYIIHALNDANFYGARFRYLEIAETLPIITHSYQQQNIQQSNQLKLILTFTIALFIILLVMMIYLNKQMLELKLARKKLKESNNNLEEVNNQLSRLNSELRDANIIKEDYIGHFLDLCAKYIRDLEDYKKSVKNMVMAKRFNELLKNALQRK
ncbi:MULTISPECIES: DUF6377 domain-containing protein [unclassified Parabacteroides]|uniref:DUF6377 domain-containing protein n=1 Tax=unclassified Parabacteroides TaxID=2649774 RepID=UPI002476FAD6|nr:MULTISPECIES: DUF6377 domain-containing protein [unclassified Parabacteroides]